MGQPPAALGTTLTFLADPCGGQWPAAGQLVTTSVGGAEGPGWVVSTGLLDYSHLAGEQDTAVSRRRWKVECRGWDTVCMERQSAGEGGSLCVWRGRVQERVGRRVYGEAECRRGWDIVCMKRRSVFGVKNFRCFWISWVVVA